MANSNHKTAAQEKSELRRSFRRRRRKLSTRQQHKNAVDLQRNLLRTALLLRYERFALYLPADGEMNTAPVISKLWEFSKQTALPCLRRSDFGSKNSKPALQMHFAPYATTTPLVRGAYNLLEPLTVALPTQFLAQVIFLPLVAFDQSGNRLGMGGGFYDRYTNHSTHRSALRVGLAHSLQQTKDPLVKEPWDVPLDAVITEREVLTFNTRAAALLQNRPGNTEQISGARHHVG